MTLTFICWVFDSHGYCDRCGDCPATLADVTPFPGRGNPYVTV